MCTEDFCLVCQAVCAQPNDYVYMYNVYVLTTNTVPKVVKLSAVTNWSFLLCYEKMCSTCNL